MISKPLIFHLFSTHFIVIKYPYTSSTYTTIYHFPHHSVYCIIITILLSLAPFSCVAPPYPFYVSLSPLSPHFMYHCHLPTLCQPFNTSTLQLYLVLTVITLLPSSHQFPISQYYMHSCNFSPIHAFGTPIPKHGCPLIQ